MPFGQTMQAGLAARLVPPPFFFRVSHEAPLGTDAQVFSHAPCTVGSLVVTRRYRGGGTVRRSRDALPERSLASNPGPGIATAA